MEIKLYNTQSPQKKINKVLTNEKTIQITMKDNENVVTPTVLLTYITGIDRYNFAYIPQLHRYYFITSYEEIIGGICAVQLKCDVLMTYKPYIEQYKALIVRKEDGGLSDIPDTRYPLKPNKNMRIIEFTTNAFESDEFTDNSQCFLLEVAGK